MEKKTKWAALAVGAAALCVLLVYGVRLPGRGRGLWTGTSSMWPASLPCSLGCCWGSPCT